MSKLDNLLETIHPRITIEQISLQANAAVNSFTIDSWQIDELEDLQKLLTDFYEHVQRRVLQISVLVVTSPDIFWGPCRNILENEYGSRWPVITMEICNSRIEGGLYSVLKRLAEGMIAQYTKNEITAKVTKFWNALSKDESLAIADEYLEKFGDLLPYDFKAGNAVRLRMNLLDVLIHHPKLISNIRNLAR